MEKTTEIKGAIILPPIERPGPRHEAQIRLENLRKAYGATWDCSLDPNDPYNWTLSRKTTISIIYSLGSLVTLMSASMIAPALKDIVRDLDIDASTAQIVFSVVFLGYGFGPFIIAGLSEMYGRKMVWVYSQVFYVVWNSLSPVGNNKVLMIVGRLMAGLGASAGITLVGPVMGDMYGKSERGKSLAIASFLPFLGPALGPILGGAMTQLVSWRWVFWIMSISSMILATASMVFIRETYTPALLRAKAVSGQSGPCPPDSTSAGTLPCIRLGTSSSNGNVSTFKKRLATNLLRPINLLIERPIIQVLSFALGLSFGVYAFLLSSYATLFQSPRYNEDREQASLHYLSITVASTIVALCSPAMDLIYDKLCKRQKGSARKVNNGSGIPTYNQTLDCSNGSDSTDVPAVAIAAESKTWHEISLEYREEGEKENGGVPEYRVPCMVPAVILVATGIFMYGWAAEKALHWIVVDVGACILNIGGFALAQGILAYQLDEFEDYAASAGAASRLLSYLMGFGFPIFAPKLYKSLGYGWGNSVIGLVWIVFGFPVPVVLWVWGGRLRGIHWGKGTRGEVV